MKVLVAGYGMAGARVVSELLTRDADVTVTAFSAEPHQPYNRIMLSTLLAGKVREDDLTLAAPPPGARVRLGVPVATIDRARRVVSTPDDEVEYDALVLATGARAVRPPMSGLDSDTVHVLRTLDDCRGIVAATASARTAVVLGGGLLGIEAARGLAGCGVQVVLVHSGQSIMDRQLDPDGAMVLTRTLRGLGIEVRTGARAVSWTGPGLVLNDGTIVEGELLVVACGARPETALAAAAGLAVGRGVLVDAGLGTSDPHIYALGDCAEHDGVVHGLVAPAWDQAATLADRLTGGSARYRGSRLVTRLKANGIDLASMGAVTADPDDEVITFADPTRGTYARLVIREDRISGAVLLGDNPGVGTIVQLYHRDAPVPADRRSLLLGRGYAGEAPTRADTPAFMPDQAQVCRCNTVSKAAITRCWRGGGRSVADVARETRATTGCGSCHDAVSGILEWLSTMDTAAEEAGT